ncbi:hypothetical protein LJC74_09945, partial [Eubacteriales bacterium OttesenSCG-928-A19]|nr:hypothetical protein [Eubacteriales bacterium OttesenSCG-928-A19]
MRKLLPCLLALLLVAGSALAITEGDYDWEGEVIAVTVDEAPMFSPAGTAEDERGLALELMVSDALLADAARLDALYAQARLVMEDGTVIAPGTAMQRGEAPQLTYLYAVPRDVEVSSLTLEFGAEGGIPAEYIGMWQGTVDNISLSFIVEADGTGEYTFEQSGYTESYPFALSVDDDTFSVDIPANNKLGIAGISGTYAYADDVLTLDVRTAFQNGGEFG